MARSTRRHHVIIGASAAGLSALEAIRSVDRASQITVLSRERAPLYSRVGLTHFLDRTVRADGMNTNGPDYFARFDAKLVAGVAAVHVDPRRRAVSLSSRRVLTYDTLLVASGSSAVIPPIPGMRLGGVHCCITRNDALAIDRTLARARQVVVVGAGLIGIQAADAVAKRKKRVAIVEQMSHVMPAMVDSTAARLFEGLLRERSASGVASAGGAASSAEVEPRVWSQALPATYTPQPAAAARNSRRVRSRAAMAASRQGQRTSSREAGAATSAGRRANGRSWS